MIIKKKNIFIKFDKKLFLSNKIFISIKKTLFLLLLKNKFFFYL